MTSSMLAALLLVTVTVSLQFDMSIAQTNGGPTTTTTEGNSDGTTTTTTTSTTTTAGSANTAGNSDGTTTTTTTSTTTTAGSANTAGNSEGTTTTTTTAAGSTTTAAGATMTSLAKICESNANCTSTANSVCQDDGTNTGTKRCLCQLGYIQYIGQDNTTTYCGQMTSSIQQPTCSLCESNDGFCYFKSTGDPAKDTSTQCLCSVSRSGRNCEVSRVNVTCSGSDMTMKICYSQQSPVNFTAGAWTMSTRNVHQPQCFGSMMKSDQPWCGAGLQGLVLNLTDSQLEVCGTKPLVDSTSKTYENTIIVQSAAGDVAPIRFVAYCTFELYQHETFSGLGVYSNNENGEAGETVTPKLSLYVVNQFSQPIPFGVAVRVGDLVRFIMTLDRTGSPFNNFNVLFCTASTSGLMPDSNAVTQPLISNGCPVLSANNQWYWSSSLSNNSLSVIETDLVPAFMLSSSPTLFIHCTVQVCLMGDTSCALKKPADCLSRQKRSTGDDSVVGMSSHGQDCWQGKIRDPSDTISSRTKRAVQSGPTVATVSGKLDVYNPNGNQLTSPTSADSLLSTSGGLIAFIGVLVFIIIVLITMGAVVAYQYKRRQLTSESYQRHSYHPDAAPQQFAMRRLYPRTVVYSRF